ncbi:MAG: Mrp/NBP35 family ATP-binding protein [Thermofilum sp.]
MTTEKERALKLEMLRKMREQEELARRRLSSVKHKVAILSGKGGVGKSFVTANLAVALAVKGRSVGVLDADIHGPSIPKILGLHGQAMYAGPAGLFPLEGPAGVRVVSADLMLPDDDSALIWRGPIKTSFLRELLSMVAWGELDYLLVDLPPGTGDEPLTVAQLIKELNGALVVTTPSELTQLVVRKAITFCKQLKIPLLGLVVNMSYFTCPVCGTRHRLFGNTSSQDIEKQLGVRVLAEIPVDPRVAESADSGVPVVLAYQESEAAKSFLKLAEEVEGILNSQSAREPREGS